MNTIELLEQLSTKTKAEIEYCLTELMMKDKIDFINVSNAYVRFLQHLNDDATNKLIEAETCVMEGFMDKITKDKKDTPCGKRNYNHTQRCLYLVNESKRFNTDKLNDEYHYDKEYGKSMSWYERNKDMK